MPEGREITVNTPLGAETLKFSEMAGHDEISGCFAYALSMVSEDLDIDACDLLGKPATITLGKDQPRHFNGIICEFRFVELRDAYAHYMAVLRPWLWLLAHHSDNRIFQNKSVVEIIEDVFAAYPDAAYEKRLQATYKPRDYCVQYGESDLDFVQRLAEDEGVFFFFEHKDGAHTLILTDANAKLKSVPGLETVAYRPNALTDMSEGDWMIRWSPCQSVVSGAYVQTDHDFKKPKSDLMTKSEHLLGHKSDGGERYFYPGTYTEIADGDRLTLIRLEEAQAMHHRVEAFGTARGLWSGAKFKLGDFPRTAENDEFLVLRVDYRMWDDQYRSGMARSEMGFQANYRLAPTALPYRPERRTRRPIMQGPQTATVVGPSGAEIFTDEYSRVKVQFHWDRLGKKDENSCCFMRVSSAWAGSGWGFIQIPRIGQEVIVDFLEGNPDHPIITGRFYNAAQMPPYGLPSNATQSGWKTNSSPGGGGYNELMFEDKAGSELVNFQAQKDHTLLVKNDRTKTVQHDQSDRIDNNAKHSVGVDLDEDVGNNKTTKVGVDRSVEIGQNDTEVVGANRSLTVRADETIDVLGNSTETIGMNHTQTVMANQTVTVLAARVDSVAATETRTVGAVQTNTILGARFVNVTLAQSHDIGASDGWEIGGDYSKHVVGNATVGIDKGRTTTIGTDDSTSVTGTRLVKVAKSQAHDVTEDLGLKSGKNIVIEAADSITLKCGSATISMKSDGKIMIDGSDISSTGSGKINVKASNDVIIKGSAVKHN